MIETAESDRVGGGRLLALLHLCDSLFPIGGFAHSDGLESATAAGAIANGPDLRAWLTVCVHETIGRLEGPALLLSWTACQAREWTTVATLDAELTALRPSSAARRASRSMGLRLATTWQSLYPDPLLAEVLALASAGAVGPVLPIAFASVCVSSAIDRRSSLEAYAYTRLAATVSASMRLLPIGQVEAHTLLAETLADVPATVDAVLSRQARPETFAPAMDIAAMTQQYVHSRLFRS